MRPVTEAHFWNIQVCWGYLQVPDKYFLVLDYFLQFMEKDKF